MRIIIADDELHIRRRLAEKIDWRALGVDDVALCSDGDEVVESVRAGGAELLLTDIRMPRMDGIAAAREAKRLCPALTVVLMSAYDDKEYLKSALDLRAAGYLEKPFPIELLKASIRNLFDNRELTFKQFTNSPLSHFNGLNVGNMDDD